MQVIKQDKEYWLLDYDWSKRGGPWNELTDVMLIGDTHNEACSVDALKSWVSLQERGRAKVDGTEREIFYAGGVQGYLDFSPQPNGPSLTLFLHSHGEDAFDSLSYYSKKIANYLKSRGCAHGLIWHEARHDRKDHQLQWP